MCFLMMQSLVSMYLSSHNSKQSEIGKITLMNLLLSFELSHAEIAKNIKRES